MNTLSGIEEKTPEVAEGTARRGVTLPGLASHIGGTPLFRLGRLASSLPRSVEVWVKAEMYNPGGSVKDRAALEIVRQALERGELNPSKTLLDASSGNTGIAYAMLGAACGFPVEIVLPANASAERQARIRAYGAHIIPSDPLEGTDGAQRLCRKIRAQAPDRYYYPDQYNNPANVQAHFLGTGPEIWVQTHGRITHLVAGVGTGGTITGTARYLRTRRAEVTVVGVSPDGPWHGLEGLKHLPSTIRPGILEESQIDRWFPVSTEASQSMAVRLAREEGILAGTSSGAAVLAALEVARSLDEGVVVAILPDGGDRYLGEPYWTEAF